MSTNTVEINTRVGVPTFGRIDTWKLDPDDIILDEELRGRIDEPDLGELAQSIKEVGQLQACLVRKDSGGKPHAIAGFSRIKAIRLLKQKEPDSGWTVLCNLRTGNEAAGFAMAAAENLVRNNLSQFEAAKVVERLRNVYNKPVEEVAADLGKTTTWVYSMEKLLALPHDLHQHIHKREVSVEAAFILAERDDREEIIRECLSTVGHVSPAVRLPKTNGIKEGSLTLKKPDKQAKVTKKDVANAVNRKRSPDTKFIPPTMAKLRKQLNKMDSLSWLEVGVILTYLNGEKSEEEFVNSATIFED